jgi:hypothetical protein
VPAFKGRRAACFMRGRDVPANDVAQRAGCRLSTERLARAIGKQADQAAVAVEHDDFVGDARENLERIDSELREGSNEIVHDTSSLPV